MNKPLVLAALLLAATASMPVAEAVGGQYSNCIPGYYKPYLNAGLFNPPTLSSTCRPVGTGASRATTVNTGTTSDCGALLELSLCAYAYQTTASAARSICAAHVDPNGFDRDCFTVNWRGTGSAAQGAVGDVVTKFRDLAGIPHEPDTSCTLALNLLGPTSCTAYGNTHTVWHGPDNVYDPNPGLYPSYVAYPGDGTFTNQCHYIRTTASAELLLEGGNLLASSADSGYNTYCFQWTSSGY